VQPPAIKLIPQIKYRHGADGQVNYGDGTPLGTVIMFMGTVAPQGYLFCDGTLYNVVDYTKFAAFIAKQFGSVNYFGGNGETTFAVPDLRGEFLRCTGTNSHAKQGNGAAVGVHQDSTEISNVFTAHVNSIYAYKFESESNTLVKKIDSVIATTNYQNRVQAIEESYSSDGPSIYTSRPTNTSIMYCIKAKSGDEQ
jgi:microcystin-dependent protein